MDVALCKIMDELDGERPRDPKNHRAKVAGSYADMLDMAAVNGRMHLEIKQNAHTFAANRKGVFIMITPACKGRTWNQALRCYECRDIVEDVFMEDKSQGDGRRPRFGDRQTVIGLTFIRMLCMIMKMEIVNRISEYAKDKKVKTKDKPRNIGRQTSESLLSILSTIEVVRGPGWEELTEVTRECWLIFRMFDIGLPKGFKR